MSKNIVAIIQARVGSTRLPNKIFLDLEGKTVLERVVERVARATLVDRIVVAIPDTSANDRLAQFVVERLPNVLLFRGSEHDVLDRYYRAAKAQRATVVVRVTSDCPLIDPAVIDRVITAFLREGVDYAANVLGERTYPRGMDVEVVSFVALTRIHELARNLEDREHVTLYLRKHPEFFRAFAVFAETPYASYRLTIDEQADYEVVRAVYHALLPQNPDFGLSDIISFLEVRPDIARINQSVVQKHGKF